MRRRPIYVRWLDSAGSGGWHTLSDIPRELMVCETVGWFVEQTDESIIVALNGVFDGTSSKPFGELIVIPLAVIEKRKWLRV